MNTQARYQLRRGSSATMPSTINPYEPIFTTDEQELYVGNADGSPIRVSSKKEINILNNLAVKHSTESLIYYVSPTGSDENEGLNEAEPKQTLQAVINSLPKFLMHDIVIMVQEGTYDQNVVIRGFVGGGTITIKGNTEKSTSNTSKYKFATLDLRYNTITVTINGLYFSANSTVIYSFNNNDIIINYCIREGKTTSTGVGSHSSTIYLVGCIINKCNIAIYSYDNSSILLNNISGSENSIVLRALYGGIINKSGITITGTTMEVVNGGGLIK